MRFILLRIVLPLLLFLLLRYLFKSVSRSMRETAPPDPTRATRSGGELKQDPVCGAFVAPETGVTAVVEGRTLHFCSTGCRDRFRA